MYDVIIIGAGPAGISAALYAKRANLNVLVIYKGISNVEKAEKIDNYYGFVNGISGKELYNNGIKQAKNLGVEFYIEEVTAIEIGKEGYIVDTPNKKYIGKTIVISTGNKKVTPNIKGLKKFEGKGISYCAICDAFFYKNKNIAVIGNGEFAITESKILKNVTNNITILTDGQVTSFNYNEFNVENKKIKEIVGEVRVEKIIFEDNTELSIDGIFIAMGEAGAIDFARSLGILIDNNDIKINEKMETNLPGVYACGNITGGLLQISKAVYEGAVAGINAAKFIKGGKENG